MERELEVKLRRVQEANKIWSQNASYLNTLCENARTFEKNGDILSAIDTYLKAIDFSRKAGFQYVNFGRCFDRLVILYRKQKDYLQEESIIKTALSEKLDKVQRAKYKERLTKVQQLLNKSK